MKAKGYICRKWELSGSGCSAVTLTEPWTCPVCEVLVLLPGYLFSWLLRFPFPTRLLLLFILLLKYLAHIKFKCFIVFYFIFLLLLVINSPPPIQTLRHTETKVTSKIQPWRSINSCQPHSEFKELTVCQDPVLGICVFMFMSQSLQLCRGCYSLCRWKNRIRKTLECVHTANRRRSET